MSPIYRNFWPENVDILFEMTHDVTDAQEKLDDVRKKFYRACTGHDYASITISSSYPQRTELLLKLAECTCDDDVWKKSGLSKKTITRYCDIFNNYFGVTSIRSLLRESRMDLVFKWLNAHHMAEVADDVLGLTNWGSYKNMPYQNDALKEQLLQQRQDRIAHRISYKEVYLTRSGHYSFDPPVKKGEYDYNGSRYVFRALIEIMFSKEEKEEFYKKDRRGRPPKTNAAKSRNQAVDGLCVKQLFYSAKFDCFRFRLPVTIQSEENELQRFDAWLKSFSKLFLNSKSHTYQLKPLLNYSDYITSKQVLLDILPDPIDKSEQSPDYCDILFQKLEEYYHAHQRKDSTLDDCYEMNILLDILHLPKYSSNNKTMDNWMVIKSRKQGPTFSKLVIDCLARALNNSLLIAQVILEQDATSDIRVVERNLQNAITQGFHSV